MTVSRTISRCARASSSSSAGTRDAIACSLRFSSQISEFPPTQSKKHAHMTTKLTTIAKAIMRANLTHRGEVVNG